MEDSQINLIQSEQIQALESIGVDESLREKLLKWVEEMLNDFIKKGNIDSLRFVENFSTLEKTFRSKVDSLLANDPQKEEFFYEKLSSIRRAIMGGFEIINVLGEEISFEVFPSGSPFVKTSDTKESVQNQKENDHPANFPRKYWTIITLKELKTDFTVRPSLERKDKTESYVIFFIPEYNCAMAVANEYGKATYFLPLSDWQKYAKSRKIDDLRPDENINWLAMPSDVSTREDWKKIIEEYLTSMRIKGGDVRNAKEGAKLTEEKIEKRDLNKEADVLIKFIEENKKIPSFYSSKKMADLSQEEKHERSLYKLYVEHKNDLRISHERREKIQKLWEQLSPHSDRQMQKVLNKNVEALIKFLEENNKIPILYQEKKAIDLTEEERFERKLVGFYRTNKDNSKIPQKRRNKMTELWNQLSPRVNEWSFYSLKEKFEILIKFMEEKKRLPIQAKKKAEDMTKEEKLEMSLSTLYLNNGNKKNDVKIPKETKERAVKLWNQLSQKSNRWSNINPEKKADILIQFIKKHGRIPSPRGKSKKEKILVGFYRTSENSPKIPLEKREEMTKLWEEFKIKESEWSKFTLQEKVDKLIEFMKQNKRIPSTTSSSKKKTTDIKNESALYYFYKTNKDNPEISQEKREGMVELWESLNSHSEEWSSHTMEEKANLVIKFIRDHNKIPSGFPQKKATDMTNEEKHERSLNNFYRGRKDNPKISKKKRKEMTALWDKAAILIYKDQLEETVDAILEFIAKNGRNPFNFPNKKVSLMTSEEKHERSLYDFYIRNKNHPKISKEKRKEVTTLWNKTASVVNRDKIKDQLEKTTDIIIAFLRDNKRMPRRLGRKKASLMTSEEKHERALNDFYLRNKDNPKILKKKRTLMISLWDKNKS
jgi:hypothetical protein